MAIFNLYWLNGCFEQISGEDINGAIKNAGIGSGTIAALDFYEPDSCGRRWEWDSSACRWVKIPPNLN